MPASPSVEFGPTVRRRTGYVRTASVSGVILAVGSASFTGQNTFQYTHYVVTPPTGVKQKTAHARGTNEVNVSLSGEVTQESASTLASLLSPSFRGTTFPIRIQQQIPPAELQRCLLENITLSGDPNGIVAYSITARCLDNPVAAGLITQVDQHHPIPAWSSGNELVQSWSLSHQIPLTPRWRNNSQTLPEYYRPGESEYNMSVTSLVQLKEHDRIQVGVGMGITVQALVTSRVISTGGGNNDPMTFRTELTNVNINADTLTSGFLISPASQNEIQRVSIAGTATGGTFRLAFADQPTGPIPHDATATLVKTALESLSNIEVGDVSVTGVAGGPWDVEFTGNLGFSNVSEMLTDGSALVGTATDVFITITQNGQISPDDVLGWPDVI